MCMWIEFDNVCVCVFDFMIVEEVWFFDFFLFFDGLVCYCGGKF